MTNRPSSHINDDRAINFIIQQFIELGWTCEIVGKDYGEDLLVRVFEAGLATNKFFFVQSKSSADLDKYRTSDGNYSFPFKIDHLEQWKSFRHPVLLIVYDVNTRIAYWEGINNIHRSKSWAYQKTKSLKIPANNVLDGDKISELIGWINNCYTVFDETKLATDIIEEQLLEKYGMKVEFSPEFGLIWLPNGTFTPAPEGGVELTVFGEMGRLLEQAMSVTGKDGQETLMQIVHDFLEKK